MLMLIVKWKESSIIRNKGIIDKKKDCLEFVNRDMFTKHKKKGRNGTIAINEVFTFVNNYTVRWN